MQRRGSLLPTVRKRVKLAAGESLVVTSLAVGYELNANKRKREDQEDVNITAFMQNEPENKPNNEKGCTKRPHSGNLSSVYNLRF